MFIFNSSLLYIHICICFKKNYFEFFVLFFCYTFRYWFDQAAFVIAKKYYPNFPPPTSPLWEWPKDLLAPDLTFYIDEPETDKFPRSQYKTSKSDEMEKM